MTSAQTDSRFQHMLRRSCDAGLAVAVAMLLTMTALIVLQVVFRNFFNIGLPWADELARFAGLWVVYLVAPRLLLQGRHISVDMMVGLFRGKMRMLFHVLNETSVLAFCALLLLSLHAFLLRAANFSTPAIGMPNWLFYMPAIIGFALLTLVAISRLLYALRTA